VRSETTLSLVVSEPLENLHARLKTGEIELEHETRERELTEQCFKDVQRECRNPLVAPALLKAFTEIAHLNEVSTPVAK
jgi:hypothetical protein